MFIEMTDAISMFERLGGEKIDERIQTFAASKYRAAVSWTGGATTLLSALGIQPGSSGILDDASFPYGMQASSELIGFNPKEVIGGHGQYTSAPFAMALATEMFGHAMHAHVQRGEITNVAGLISVGAGISNVTDPERRARNGAQIAVGGYDREHSYRLNLVDVDIAKGVLSRGEQDALFTIVIMNCLFERAQMYQIPIPCDVPITSGQFRRVRDGFIIETRYHLIDIDRSRLDREGAILFGIDGQPQRLSDLDPERMVFAPLTARPMTSGHLQILRSAGIRATGAGNAPKEPIAVLSLNHHSKGDADLTTMQERVSQFTGATRVLLLRNGALFRDTIQFIRDTAGYKDRWHDIVEVATGFDAPEILLDPSRYTGESEEERLRARNATLRDIQHAGARFLVAGRDGKTLEALLPQIPGQYRDLFHMLPVQSSSVSSTKVRAAVDELYRG